ncbi:MAG: hypothetical protein IPL83_05985 [Bdellovibrionales bacterium]|nr:hypothetical protein [Bdellovibrionales bacterium]
MKSKFLKTISALFVLVLTACGGAGGGSATNSSEPSPDPVPIDGDASNGLNEYYYFSKDDPRNISLTASMPKSSTIGVENQFFIQITESSTADMNIGLFAPKCLLGATTNSYAMVLISGDGPSLVSLRTQSSAIEIEELSYDNNLNQKKGEGVQVLAGDCNEGIFLSDDTTTVVIANDAVAIVTDGSGNIYVGLNKNMSFNSLQNTPIQVSSETTSFNEAPINSYHFWQSNAPLLGVTNQSSSGGYFDNGQFFGMYHGAVETAFGNGQANLVLNTSTNIESHHTVVKGQGSYFARELRGTSGVINGRTIFFGSMSGLCINTQGSYTECFGVDAFVVASEQE